MKEVFTQLQELQLQINKCEAVVNAPEKDKYTIAEAREIFTAERTIKKNRKKIGALILSQNLK